MPEINDNGRIRRTDARVKGDAMDFILQQAQKASDPKVFMYYPERVLKILRSFYSVWKLPEYSIPKKKSSKFAQWVSELDQLNAICGSDIYIQKAMEMSLETFKKLPNKFMITHPLSIKNLLVDAIGEINRNKPTPVEIKVKEEFVKAKDLKDDLKNIFAEED